MRRSNKLELLDTSTPLILKIDEKLKEAEILTNNTVNILEKDLSQLDDDFQNINKIYKKKIPYYSKQTPQDLHLASSKTNYKSLNPRKTTPKTKIDNTNICYKYGKLGHYAKNCIV